VTLAILLHLSLPALAAWNCEPLQARCHSVFIVRNWWHAAIVVGRADIPLALMPELKEFPPAQMIEFSWGDRDYFPDPAAGIYAGLRAAFWSRGSVLHLVGFDGQVKNFYRGASTTELHLSEENFARLLAFLDSSFARPEPSHPAQARAGLYPYSRFYDATGSFGVLRTCNAWVAEALQAAGLPIDPRFVFTANDLNGQLSRLTERQ
jgi:uncharacterized protein (TIGR02117 family)